VLLFPANPEECFYLTVKAFDLAERLQTPVMVLSDLDIGMNDWMCPDLKWEDSYQPDRGKMLSKEEVLKLDRFFRFVDRDEDGITYRTLPGVHPKASYFTRGSGHTQYGGYTEDSTEYQLVLDRLKRKFSTAARMMPPAIIDLRGPFEVGIVAVGSSDGAVHEALDILKARGVGVNYMRIRAFPFGREVTDFLDKHEIVFVVEQNRDAQLRSLLTLETPVDKKKLRSILHYSGLSISSECIVNGIMAEVGEGRSRITGAAS
jgi:2-oxoglutarate ferredoxin oxidoreductase subunit alpha